MNAILKKRLWAIFLVSIPLSLWAAAALTTKKSRYPEPSLIDKTDHILVYVDHARAYHRIILSADAHAHVADTYAHLCFATHNISSDFSLFIDPSVAPQECSLCKKIGLHFDVPHAHVAVGEGSGSIPAKHSCEFCEIAQGKRIPGINQDGRIIHTSKNAALFTKGSSPNILNNCLAVSKFHRVNLKDMASTDIPIIADIFTLIAEVMHKQAQGLPYVVVTNNGAHSPCVQAVPHMHFHVESPDHSRFNPERFRWKTNEK